MRRITSDLGRTPNRLSEPYAKGLIGLSLFTLLLAVLGLFIYEGLLRVAYVVAFASMSFGNLAWGIGSLLLEDSGGLTARRMARPFSLVMLVALPIAVALLVINGR